MAPVPNRSNVNPNNPLYQHIIDGYTNDVAREPRRKQHPSNSGGSGGGGRRGLSHKTSVRKSRGKEKEESYSERLEGKMMKGNKRKQRMERYRKLY